MRDVIWSLFDSKYNNKKIIYKILKKHFSQNINCMWFSLHLFHDFVYKKFINVINKKIIIRTIYY